MRDAIFALVLAACIPLAIARPFIGACVFAWVSLMNPHKHMWGFAADISWAQHIALATLIGLLIEQQRLLADSIRRWWIALTYCLWTVFTTFFALNTTAAIPKLTEFVKIQLMCLITLALLTSRERIQWFVFAIVTAVGFYGVKGGVFTVLSGGEHRVWGPFGTVLGDNNQLAVALTMTVPLLYWLMHHVQRRWLKFGFGAAALLHCAAILGSQSRGALLAIAAMGLFLFTKSRNKVAFGAIGSVVLAFGLIYMPDSYWERMNTILEYQTDSSAGGRLHSWATAIRVASDRITGGGFEMYVDGAAQQYATEVLKSAHSIYFQALGEHGFVGFALFMAFWITIGWRCQRLARTLPAEGPDSTWRVLAQMCQVSLVGYAVGGAFVNVGYWDYPFDIALIVLAIERQVATAPARQPIGAGRSSVSPFPDEESTRLASSGIDDKPMTPVGRDPLRG